MDIKEKQRLKRLAGETEEAYLWRIGQMVDTAILPSWSEINDVVNGELGIDEDKWRDESAFRKKYQAAKKFYDNVFSKSQGTASGENLDEKIDTIKKLTVSLRDERNELNRKYREASRRDAYIDQLVRAVKEADLGVLDYDDNKNFKGVLESDNDMIISFSDVFCVPVSIFDVVAPLDLSSCDSDVCVVEQLEPFERQRPVDDVEDLFAALNEL